MKPTRTPGSFVDLKRVGVLVGLASDDVIGSDFDKVMTDNTTDIKAA